MNRNLKRKSEKQFQEKEYDPLSNDIQEEYEIDILKSQVKQKKQEKQQIEKQKSKKGKETLEEILSQDFIPFYDDYIPRKKQKILNSDPEPVSPP